MNTHAPIPLPDGRSFDVLAFRVLAQYVELEVQERRQQMFREFHVFGTQDVLRARGAVREWLEMNRQPVPVSRCCRPVVIEIRL